MFFAHAFVSAGSVAPVRSRHIMRDLQDGQRVSVGLGVAFIFRNIFRLEVNYVAPIKHCVGDSQSTGVHIGCGVNFL
ncbi:hypothetical protein ANCDUO_11602 [Ancylostoma duodenale]|uniref:Bacterial surface antigen (D15) domain-containing protein n=1 Tax=Ancylostoma duodenale TaxID=51022 RepID=A0A0C2GH50_9BILA|nr:hypothetical protein ANCDUO_11602 [Ancylostoma duodenale]